MPASANTSGTTASRCQPMCVPALQPLNNSPLRARPAPPVLTPVLTPHLGLPQPQSVTRLTLECYDTLVDPESAGKSYVPGQLVQKLIELG